MTFLFAIVLAMRASLPVSGQQASPQPPPDCAAPEHRQFDFWIGTWAVTAQGQPAGANQIEMDLKGCVLVERWTAASGSRGTSLNFYDRNTQAWYQTWIDERGGVLRLRGGLDAGRMVMTSDAVPNRAGVPTLQRITWSVEPDQSVRQVWETSSDAGATWTAVFDGRYVRR